MAGLDGAFVNEERSAAVWYNTMPVFLFARSMPTSPKYAYLWPVSATTTAAVSEREVKLVYPTRTHTQVAFVALQILSNDIIRVRFRALLSCRSAS